MNRIVPKCILIDLSGTIHVENQLIKGAEKSIIRLRQSGINFRFVTNSTKESTSNLYKRLVALGLDVLPGDLFTSLSSAKRFILQNDVRPMLFLEDKALEDFQDVDINNPNAVVVGLAPSMFHYEKLTEAFNCLSRGADLIAINKSRYFQRQQGLALGGGAFVAALEYSASTTATLIGKPSRKFFEQSIADFEGITLEDCVMIGDDVRDDVAGAQAVGMKAILVQTGKYRVGDESKISPGPFMTLPSISEAVDHILSLVSPSS